jgi:transposase
VVGLAGPRIFLFRRDAINLAKLHRAGELTSVWVLDKAHEAIRDLVRARQAAVRTLRQARQQLSGFLLRQGHHLAWVDIGLLLVERILGPAVRAETARFILSDPAAPFHVGGL